MDTFLSDDEVIRLTGRKMKARQVEALRNMGVPFFLNALEQPVVARSAIEGGRPTVEQKKKWAPNVLRIG